MLATREAAEFQRGANKFIAQQVKQSLDHMVAPENRMRLHHGRSWGETIAEVSEASGSLKEKSAETTIKFDSLLHNDLKVLVEFLDHISQAMSTALVRDMYATVSEAAEDVGNVVSQREAGSFAKAFLEMLKKIEFGVDAQGQVTLPSMHVPPEAGQRMLDELHAQGPEFQAEVQRIKREKSEAALKRERERLARYRT